jgi:hypothetical protein
MNADGGAWQRPLTTKARRGREGDWLDSKGAIHIRLRPRERDFDGQGLLRWRGLGRPGGRDGTHRRGAESAERAVKTAVDHEDTRNTKGQAG